VISGTANTLKDSQIPKCTGNARQRTGAVVCLGKREQENNIDRLVVYSFKVDNVCADNQGRLWIATDQGEYWPRTGRSDGLYALETDGERRRTSKLFFRCPIGAELCGPCFTPDGETLFVALQHPAADGAEALIGFGRPSTFTDPATTLARFRSEDAAASIADRHYQGWRRQDRLIRFGGLFNEDLRRRLHHLLSPASSASRTSRWASCLQPS
jgi:secreted PhoX family phosphatase